MTDLEIVEKFERYYSQDGGIVTDLQVKDGQRLVQLARRGLARLPDAASAQVEFAVGHIAGTASVHDTIVVSVRECGSIEKALCQVMAMRHVTHAAVVRVYLPPVLVPRIEGEVVA